MSKDDDTVVEMGKVSIETSGNSNVGVDETMTGFRYLPAGIAEED